MPRPSLTSSPAAVACVVVYTALLLLVLPPLSSATTLQFSLILSLPLFTLAVLLATGPGTRRSYLLLVCFSNVLVTGCGWEAWWSCGLLRGLSYSERHDEGGVDNWDENVMNVVATTSMDCWLQVLVFVSSSWIVSGRTKALDPPRSFSRGFLSCIAFAGVLQNCVVTLCLPNTVEGVCRAPLAPLDVDVGIFAVVNGRALSVGNNIMWVFAPWIVYAAVLRVWGGEEEEGEGEGGGEKDGEVLTKALLL
ncbi:hypothetical protein TeGR_g43 [Tetraparma gracilis]|uniref:Uncharacterized protein n=1 Tax=Tetraparma gracilis TaxID=2962635 RepID=A0ABQ6MUD0_9STRA|nr:hypothetical protein TeGR_g43 [Tetraparma gracilis]